jgi:hypothetical protein
MVFGVETGKLCMHVWQHTNFNHPRHVRFIAHYRSVRKSQPQMANSRPLFCKKQEMSGGGVDLGQVTRMSLDHNTTWPNCCERALLILGYLRLKRYMWSYGDYKAGQSGVALVLIKTSWLLEVCTLLNTGHCEPLGWPLLTRQINPLVAHHTKQNAGTAVCLHGTGTSHVPARKSAIYLLVEEQRECSWSRTLFIVCERQSEVKQSLHDR